jgi:pyruvate/2-oxoglutarate dehydrogenase complex dihydrolipoamide acyltransferase (E2) component
MATRLRVPKAAVSMEEGKLIEWLVADGQPVAEGQTLYVLETEKTTVEIDAPESGVLKHIGAAGTTYKVGELIGEIR